MNTRAVATTSTAGGLTGRTKAGEILVSGWKLWSVGGNFGQWVETGNQYWGFIGRAQPRLAFIDQPDQIY